MAKCGTRLATSTYVAAMIINPMARADIPASSPQSSDFLAEIVVTAQKREEKLQDVPVAITVVGGQQLADQHVYTVADLARTTPALEMIQAFGGPGGGGQIRGIGTNAFTRSAEGAVGIVVDGVPQGNANSNNIFDMQQVEVLRGPQGTLFGLTSSAGVINMVTVAPDPSKFATIWHLDEANKGTAGSQFGHQTLRGVLNAPLTGDSALRVSATADLVKGVQRNAFTGEDHVSHEYGARARYRFTSGSVDVNVIADYDKITQNYSDPQFNYAIVPAGTKLANELAACGITASFANNSRCTDPSQVGRQVQTVRNYGASVQLDFHASIGTLTSITGLRRNLSGPGNGDIMSTPQEIPQIFRNGLMGSDRQFSQEFRIASASTTPLEYVAGVFYSSYKGTQSFAPNDFFFVGLVPAPGVFIPFVKNTDTTETTNKAAAVFGQLTYHITEQLGLIAGARYTHQKIDDKDVAADLAPFGPGTPPGTPPTITLATQGLSKSNVSGKLGLQYKFAQDLTGYLTATRGYKGPQVQAVQGSANVLVAAEIPTAYELGLKGAVLNGMLNIDASVFHTSVKNYQGQQCFLAASGAQTCVPSSVDVTTKGVELDVYGRPVQGLLLNAGIIYDIAEYPSGYTGGDPNNLVVGTLPGKTNLGGKQLMGVPKTKFTFSGDYSMALGSIEGFVGGDTVYKSALLLGPYGDDRFVYPSHWTVGARMGVRAVTGGWSANLYARNLTNEHEPVTLFAGPSVSGNAVAGISGWIVQSSLREVGLSLDFKF